TALEKLAGEHGIDHRVHLAGQRSDVPSILAESDLFVLTSRMEGFSVALLEAMRAALPIIATDVGGVRDALCDEQGTERAGWVVPPVDETALAATLGEVLNSLTSPQTQTRRAEAHRRAVEDYTVHRMLDGVENVLLLRAATARGSTDRERERAPPT